VNGATHIMVARMLAFLILKKVLVFFNLVNSLDGILQDISMV